MELTNQDVITLLKSKAAEAGSQKVLAHRLNVSPPFLSRVMKGKDSPTTKMLAALNLESAKVYRTKE